MAVDLNKKSASELQKMLTEERQKLYELRLKLSVNQLKEVRQVRATRKRIAQILTQLKKATDEEVSAQA